jgi:hypothetical protein
MKLIDRIRTLPGPVRWLFYLMMGIVLLAVLYGVGRGIDVYLGSFYSGDRAPYLQMPAPDAITVRWQTRTAGRDVVRYGPRPGFLPLQVDEKDATEEHEVRLTGLRPGTRYYYQISHNGVPRYSGPGYWFITPPPPGTPVEVRFAVLGDPGDPTPDQIRVRDAMLTWLAQHPRPGRPELDLLLTTGDNAYRSGTNSQYQAGFFNPYGKILHNIPVWPIYGNHDARRYAFFNIFSFPANAESGGVPSGTEHYYAFDYGPAHFVVLDTVAGDLSKDSPMLRWLKHDLSANRLPWLIAIFHHPPYTHGSHNSDDVHDSGGRMFDLRENVLPLLEQAGTDLVLSGHSHMYERTTLLACHYGTSDSLTPSMRRGPELERTQQFIYQKPARGEHTGTIYTVIGSSAKVDQGPLDHPAMAVSEAAMGAVVVSIQGQRLKGTFIREDGSVGDEFVLLKVPGKTVFSCD